MTSSAVALLVRKLEGRLAFKKSSDYSQKFTFGNPASAGEKTKKEKIGQLNRKSKVLVVVVVVVVIVALNFWSNCKDWLGIIVCTVYVLNSWTKGHKVNQVAPRPF